MRLALALFVLSLGCADPCADLGDPAIELGTSDADAEAFVPLREGDDVSLHAGVQGGAHLWLHARVTGLCADRALVDRRVLHAESGATLVAGRGTVGLVETPEGLVELEQPIRMVLCPPPAGRAIQDEALRVVVSTEDADGRRADVTLGIVARCDDEACVAFCRER